MSAPDYRPAFEAVPGVHLLIGLDAPRHGVLAVSRDYLGLRGLPPSELCGRPLLDVLRDDEPDPAGDAELARAIDGARHERTPHGRATHRLPLRRVARRWWQPVVTPVRDGEGAVTQVIVTLEEIEAHGGEEHHFHRAMDLAPIGMALVGIDGKLLRVNQALCEMLGYTADELAQRSFQQLTHPNDRERDRELREKLLASEIGSYQLEKRYLRKDGTQLMARLHAALMRGADGAPRYFIGQFEDVTGEKRAERAREALREAALTISMLHPDRRQNVPAVLQTIVDSARQLTGADYAALGIGTDPSRSFSPWVASGISAELAERIGNKPRPVGLLGYVAIENQSLRVCPAHADRRAHGLPPHHPPVDAFLGVPIRHGGDRPIGNLYLGRRPGEPPFSDADQSILELLAGHAAIAIENAQLYDRLDQMVAAREELLAVVSHDLKSPLNAISLREQLLARGDANPQVRGHVESVRRSIATMLRMIGGLLDAASLDAGHLRLDIEPRPLLPIVREVFDGIAPIAIDRTIQLDTEIPDGMTVKVDRERFLQILGNLVGNALKFTGTGGRIVIRAESCGGQALISVADNGIGIRPDILPRIFDRFVTTEYGHSGTGLGLNIVKRLVEAHQGRITVESEVGHGTTFRLTLPE